jgi:hypothetical protein
MNTTIDILGKIIGSVPRVKLMRLFLFHPQTGFTKDQLLKKTKITPSFFKSELSLLEKATFIEKQEAMVVFPVKNGPSKKKKAIVYVLNKEFPLLEPLRGLLIESELIGLQELSQRFKTSGKIKLFIVSGLFMKDDRSSLDLLIVGDRLDTGTVQKTIIQLEAEIGKELRYATFSVEEFLYRMKMYDKLLRDIFDFPNKKLINQMPNGSFS